MTEIKKEVLSFQDKPYTDKRMILRQYAHNNSLAYQTKLYIINSVSNGNNDILPGIDIEELIDTLLVDGYVAYERFFNAAQDKILAYVPIDPISLTLTNDHKTNSKYWVQENTPETKRVLTESQVLYIKYPILNAKTSFIGQLYTKQIEFSNFEKLTDFTLSYVIKKLRELLGDIKQTDLNILETLKQ